MNISSWSKKAPMEIEERYQITKKVTLTGAATNCALASVQIIFGLVGQSQALLADGLHTLSDLSSDFIVLIATRQSARVADAGHPYGHGRIETLASLALGLLLAGVALGIGYRGVVSMFSSESSNPKLITLIFASLAIFSKEFLYHYTMRAAKKVHSSLLESNAWHHRSDVLSSIVVVVGISSQLLGIAHMDAIAAIVVAIMIAVMAYRLSKRALEELIDTSLNPDLVQQVKSLMEHNDSVQAIHSLRTRSMGGLGCVDAEIRVDPRLTVSEAHHIAFSLERQIEAELPQIVDVSIHVDPLSEPEHEAVTDLPPRHKIQNQLNEIWAVSPFLNRIEQIRFHYLNRQIEIDIIFPEALASNQFSTQIEEMANQARGLSYVGAVRLYFSR